MTYCVIWFCFPAVHTYRFINCVAVIINSCRVFAVVCAVMELLFSEELGLVLEVSHSDLETVCQRYTDAGLQCCRIGRVSGFGPEAVVRHGTQRFLFLCFCPPLSSNSMILKFVSQVSVHVDGQEVLREPLPNLRGLWEDTSFQLERLQANELCVKQEEEGLARRTQPYFKLTFDPSEAPSISQICKNEQDDYH